MKTILVVEDTELNIDLITQLLEDDYNLLFARDGRQGVERGPELRVGQREGVALRRVAPVRLRRRLHVRGRCSARRGLRSND